MLEPKQREQVEAAAKLLRGVDNLLFVTGAGISADSGLPTYRGVGGLYDDAETEDGYPIEVCLSGPMYRREPSRTWKYIREIERACRGAQPNAGHRRIAELEQARERVWVLTQNVDGLHHAAGSDKVIAIHGTLHELRCSSCGWRDRVADFAELDQRISDAAVPVCPQCGEPIRPDVVLFEEMLPAEAIASMQRELRRGFDAVVSIGTSGCFPTSCVRSSTPMLNRSRRSTSIRGSARCLASSMFTSSLARRRPWTRSWVRCSKASGNDLADEHARAPTHRPHAETRGASSYASGHRAARAEGADQLPRSDARDPHR